MTVTFGNTTAQVWERCCHCTAADDLGVVARPGKILGLLCARCWRRSAHSLIRSHGYRFWPVAELELEQEQTTVAA